MQNQWFWQKTGLIWLLAIIAIVFVTVVGLFTLFWNKQAPSANHPRAQVTATPMSVYEGLLIKAKAHGSVHIIVGLNVAPPPDNWVLDPQLEAQYRAQIANAQQQFLIKLKGHQLSNAHSFDTIPYIALTTDADGLAYLQSLPEVTSIDENGVSVPFSSVYERTNLHYLSYIQ